MTSVQWLYLVLADAVLIIHFLFVAFVALGLVLIWIGWWRRWAFVRKLWFRVAHLGAIAVVVGESLASFACPLTEWENRLRLLAGGEQRYEGSFLQHWLHRLMFFDLNESVFTGLYVVFFLLVVLSLWVVPPHWRRRAEDLSVAR